MAAILVEALILYAVEVSTFLFLLYTVLQALQGKIQ